MTQHRQRSDGQIFRAIKNMVATELCSGLLSAMCDHHVCLSMVLGLASVSDKMTRKMLPKPHLSDARLDKETSTLSPMQVL